MFQAHDCVDHEAESGGAERLAFERPVAHFTILMEEDRAFEFMRSLVLVEAGLANAGVALRLETTRS